MRSFAHADPVKFVAALWPNIHLYSKQRDILYSVCENDDTVVVAGNMLGKDFVSGLLTLYFFLTRTPCRIVTTSADHSQLEAVLWGEIRRFIQTSRLPLSADRGGPLLINHLHLRQVVRGEVVGLSYCLGRVAAKGEGMLGHHIADVGDGIPRTLFVADEASGVDDVAWERADTWARRRLAIGNPYKVGAGNFFYRAVKAGDMEATA